jgi:hypothetical protein
MSILTDYMPKVAPHVILVGKLILREASVFVDPEHGPAMRSGVGNIVFRDLVQGWLDSGDEFTHRGNHV